MQVVVLGQAAQLRSLLCADPGYKRPVVTLVPTDEIIVTPIPLNALATLTPLVVDCAVVVVAADAGAE